MKLRTISMLTVALVIVLVAVTSRLTAEKKVDVLWDKYGVPHIFAADRESMFYAHGWAQMQNQANLLLRLYGESRGRAAEYWGPSNVELDRWVQLNGVPERAKVWYDAQDPTFRGYLDAFARGINDFAKAHPEAIDADKRVGPSGLRLSTSSATRFARCTTATWRRRSECSAKSTRSSAAPAP
jgi:acyl-homoserine-lactone acylase